MTREEAIIAFEKQLHSAVAVLDGGFGTHPGESDRNYRKRKEMAEIALLALHAQQDAEKNDPLTLEELRDMDGKPVWLPEPHCWVLVTHNSFVPLFTFPDGEQCSAIDWFEQIGPAYRHKPKEGTK